MVKRGFDLAEIGTTLSELPPEVKEPKELTVSAILEIALKVYNEMFYSWVPIDRILSVSRRREFVIIRSIASYLGYKNLCLSSTQVGKELNNKDHATVLHMNRNVAKWISTPTYEMERHLFRQVEQELNRLIETGEYYINPQNYEKDNQRRN